MQMRRTVARASPVSAAPLPYLRAPLAAKCERMRSVVWNGPALHKSSSRMGQIIDCGGFAVALVPHPMKVNRWPGPKHDVSR